MISHVIFAQIFNRIHSFPRTFTCLIHASEHMLAFVPHLLRCSSVTTPEPQWLRGGNGAAQNQCLFFRMSQRGVATSLEPLPGAMVEVDVD